MLTDEDIISGYGLKMKEKCREGGISVMTGGEER